MLQARLWTGLEKLQVWLWTGLEKLQAWLWTRPDKLQAVLRFRLHKLQAMEPIHIFYKEPPADENNIFTANVAEENEVEGVRFKKSKEYAITGLSINQDVDSIAATDTDRQEAICNLIQKLVKEKKDPDRHLWIYNEEEFEKIFPFKNKSESEIPPIKLTFYNTTTIKKEVEF